VNKPPVALAKPSTQEVNEPNDLVIDGSGTLIDYFNCNFIKQFFAAVYTVIHSL